MSKESLAGVRKQGINGLIIDAEVILGELFIPTDLSEAQALSEAQVSPLGSGFNKELR